MCKTYKNTCANKSILCTCKNTVLSMNYFAQEMLVFQPSCLWRHVWRSDATYCFRRPFRWGLRPRIRWGSVPVAAACGAVHSRRRCRYGQRRSDWRLHAALREGAHQKSDVAMMQRRIRLSWWSVQTTSKPCARHVWWTMDTGKCRKNIHVHLLTRS